MDKKELKAGIFIITLLVLIAYTGFKNENVIDRSGHHDHSDHYHDHSHGETVDASTTSFLPTPNPDRVILNLTETPETSVAVNWRTDTATVDGSVEWAEATAGTEFQNNVKKVVARQERLKVKHLEENMEGAGLQLTDAEFESITAGA